MKGLDFTISQEIPGEEWSLWYPLNFPITYSQQYWSCADKLGENFNLVN